MKGTSFQKRNEIPKYVDLDLRIATSFGISELKSKLFAKKSTKIVRLKMMHLFRSADMIFSRRKNVFFLEMIVNPTSRSMD